MAFLLVFTNAMFFSLRTPKFQSHKRSQLTFRILEIPTPLFFYFGIFQCSNTKEDSTIPHASEFWNPHGKDSLNYSSKETSPIREHIKKLSPKIKKILNENRTKHRKLEIYIFHKYHLVAYSLLHL